MLCQARAGVRSFFFALLVVIVDLFLSWVYLVGKIGYLTGCSRGCFCQSIEIHKAPGRSDSDANSEFGSNGETSHFLALLQADCVSGFFSALRV